MAHFYSSPHPLHPCHVLEIVSDPDDCQQKASSAWGDFTFAGDTMRFGIRSNFFLEVGLPEECSARIRSFLGHLLCGSVRCQNFTLSVVRT